MHNQAGLGYDPADRWKELVDPVLPEVAEAVHSELRLDELWAGLPEPAREQARRIAAGKSSLSLAEVDQLGGAWDLLIRSGLLVRHLEEVRAPGKTFNWIEHWGCRAGLGRALEYG